MSGRQVIPDTVNSIVGNTSRLLDGLGLNALDSTKTVVSSLNRLWRTLSEVRPETGGELLKIIKDALSTGAQHEPHRRSAILDSDAIRCANLNYDEFTEILQNLRLENGRFELRLGKPEEECDLVWRLTYKGVKSGRETAKIDGLLNEVNKHLREMVAESVELSRHYPNGWKISRPLASLGECGGFSPSRVQGSRSNVAIEATSLHDQSRNRPIISFGANGEQTGLIRTLDDLKMRITDPLSAAIAVGLFRLFAGFPKDPSDLGTERDTGDLTQGLYVAQSAAEGGHFKCVNGGVKTFDHSFSYLQKMGCGAFLERRQY
jgi:hypothetical protein